MDTSQGKRADGSEVSTTREVPDYGGHSDVAHGNGVAFVGGSLDKHEGSTRKISLEVGRNPKAASNCHPHGGATVASRKFSLPAGHYSQFSGENSFSSFTNSSNTKYDSYF